MCFPEDAGHRFSDRAQHGPAARPVLQGAAAGPDGAARHQSADAMERLLQYCVRNQIPLDRYLSEYR